MAANRIKGITIEIGRDTMKLQTALKGVNSEGRNTQQQLRDVEKLLKLDPGNTEDMLSGIEGVMDLAEASSNTNVSMMGEMFKYCAPIAGALGFSAEDTAEAIGLMANAGIKSSQAAESLVGKNAIAKVSRQPKQQGA